MAKRVRVIRPDVSGHYAGTMEVEEFRAYDWASQREVVLIGGVQVRTFEDFLRATEDVVDEPEVLFIPPMAGGA